jgi:hypothetical protein
LTAPVRVAVDNGQTGTKERRQARTKELDDEALTRGTRRGLREKRRDGGRSSRRLRTLVTQMAPRRGVSDNQIARALISMMARSNELQSEAGYICARPRNQLDDLLRRTAGPYIWVNFRPFDSRRATAELASTFAEPASPLPTRRPFLYVSIKRRSYSERHTS